jgi:hypothetical protein
MTSFRVDAKSYSKSLCHPGDLSRRKPGTPGSMGLPTPTGVIPAKAGTHPAFAEAKLRLRAGRSQHLLPQRRALPSASPQPVIASEAKQSRGRTLKSQPLWIASSALRASSQ